MIRTLTLADLDEIYLNQESLRADTDWQSALKIRKEWRLNGGGQYWTPYDRMDGRMEWLCPHGVGHGIGVHGCCQDQCCKRDDFPGKVDFYFSKELLLYEKYAYLYGLLLTDGSLVLRDRNKGQVSIEISSKDRDIIEKINNIVKGTISERERDTNFSHLHAISWANYKLEFRNWLIECGYPTENKSINADVPNSEYNEDAFWRGVIDGNGSIGVKENGNVYLSLYCHGALLKDKFINYIENITEFRPEINRNKRDGYNIVIYNHNALSILDKLYSDAEIYMNRKYLAYLSCCHEQCCKRDDYPGKNLGRDE